MYKMPCPASEAASFPIHANKLDTIGIFSRPVPFTSIIRSNSNSLFSPTVNNFPKIELITTAICYYHWLKNQAYIKSTLSAVKKRN